MTPLSKARLKRVSSRPAWSAVACGLGSREVCSSLVRALWRTASVEPPHEARQVQDGLDDDRAAAEAAHRRPHEPGAEGDDHFERVRHRPGLLALAAARPASPRRREGAVLAKTRVVCIERGQATP